MPPSSRPERPQVLIVEDEPAIAGCMATFLRTRGGVETVVAPDAMVAQTLLAAQRWDVVVVDQLLGRGPQGDTIIRTAAKADPDLPRRTIFMTGDIAEETAWRIARVGCHAVLDKPFPLARVLDAVRAILERGDLTEVDRGRRQA